MSKGRGLSFSAACVRENVPFSLSISEVYRKDTKEQIV